LIQFFIMMISLSWLRMLMPTMRGRKKQSEATLLSPRSIVMLGFLFSKHLIHDRKKSRLFGFADVINLLLWARGQVYV
jgi:hypothetical protein